MHSLYLRKMPKSNSKIICRGCTRLLTLKHATDEKKELIFTVGLTTNFDACMPNVVGAY